MDKLAAILTAIWSVIREPLMLLLAFKTGEKNGRDNLATETKDKMLEDLAKVKRIRERGLTVNDIKRMRKYSRK